METTTAATDSIDWVVEPGRPARTTVPELDLADACAWLREHRQALRAGLDEHGAVFLRGLPVRSTEDFGLVRDALIVERAGYREKATPRSHFGNDVYSSTDLPPQQSIRPHNENSYALEFPGLLLFGCLIAPHQGGATPVTDVRKVLRDVPAPLADRFRAQGWGLVRNYGEHISLGWRTAFNTEDRAEVERYCRENLIAHEWLDNGNLRTVQRRPATIRHPRTGDEVWFNHMVFWNEWSLDEDTREVLVGDLGVENLPFRTAFGNGDPVAREDVEMIDRAYREATLRETWQPGDVMIVDNLLMAHARDSFRGDRKILVAMGDPVELADCAPSTPPLAGFGPKAPAAPDATASASTPSEPKAKGSWISRLKRRP
ncbi:TauD/TfdA family dioxygenase [Kitasatospora sp. NPDC097643]|uniref:TauD/TfdA family dioxygenase n=1 Tax=Kitasatospora sp. NPDC097643 TaxID=3157230 RepID=UPI00331C2F84